LRGSSGEVDRNLVEAERAIEIVQRAAKARDLLLDVGFSQKDVAIVLGKLTQAQEPVQHAARFIAVDDAELRKPKRQVAVRQRAFLDDLRVSRTIYGFHGRALALVREREHVLAKILPMPALLPNSAAN